MYTFSQMIDNLIAEMLRPDLRVAMANGLNQTIRELHFTQQASPVGYAENLIEEQLVATVDVGFTYPLTEPVLFQMMESVFFATVGEYATMRRPSSIQAFVNEIGGQQYGWYRTGDHTAYQNYGGKDAEIWQAWFMYLPRLAYYPVGARPATWNEATQSYDFLPAYDVDAVTRAQAMYLSTNWMINRWWDLLASGVRAKMWARLGDEVRGKTSYSLYEAQRPNLVAAETYDMAPRYRR